MFTYKHTHLLTTGIVAAAVSLTAITGTSFIAQVIPTDATGGSSGSSAPSGEPVPGTGLTPDIIRKAIEGNGGRDVCFTPGTANWEGNATVCNASGWPVYHAQDYGVQPPPMSGGAPNTQQGGSYPPMDPNQQGGAYPGGDQNQQWGMPPQGGMNQQWGMPPQGGNGGAPGNYWDNPANRDQAVSQNGGNLTCGKSMGSNWMGISPNSACPEGWQPIGGSASQGGGGGGMYPQGSMNQGGGWGMPNQGPMNQGGSWGGSNQGPMNQGPGWMPGPQGGNQGMPGNQWMNGPQGGTGPQGQGPAPQGDQGGWMNGPQGGPGQGMQQGGPGGPSGPQGRPEVMIDGLPPIHLISKAMLEQLLENEIPEEEWPMFKGLLVEQIGRLMDKVEKIEERMEKAQKANKTSRVKAYTKQLKRVEKQVDHAEELLVILEDRMGDTSFEEDFEDIELE
ncbi:MAG: hypothetical protein AAB728_03115 [Patescibacteria group bacterium]